MQGPSNYYLWSFSFPLISGIFMMAHHHKILWAINSGWESLRPMLGSGGNAPIGGKGVVKTPCRKWTSKFSDPFESLFLSHIIYYMYKVYLQVFICRKWVIFRCINADSWEKDVQLHFVSGTKFYNKNVCHIVWVYQAWRLSIGCRAELNRTPLKSKILFSIFNFMNHTISSKNTLVYDIYISSLEKQILGSKR